MHKINAAELLVNFFLSLSADFYFFFFLVTIASRTAELLIRVTGVTSKFKRRTRSCLLIPSPLSLSQRDVSGGDLWWHFFPSDTGSAELCIQMTGRVAMSHNIFARCRLVTKHLADQIKAILEASTNHALRTFVSVIHTITEVARTYSFKISQRREL